MRIRIKDIPPEGLKIQEEMSLESINARMSEASGNDIIFTAGPVAELLLIPSPGGSEVSGQVSGSIKRPCPKCMEDVEVRLNEQVVLSLKHRPDLEKSSTKVSDRASEGDRVLKRAHVNNESRQWEDDIGVIFFDGEHVDLESFLQETLIIAIDPFDCPHENCPGFDQAGEEKPPGLRLADKLSEAIKSKSSKSDSHN